MIQPLRWSQQNLSQLKKRKKGLRRKLRNRARKGALVFHLNSPFRANAVNQICSICVCRKTFSRRRLYIEDENVGYINEYNRSFNKKLERAYGAQSMEIRQNLERGTAL